MRTLILFSILFLAISCSTAPDFERENTNDPGANTFIPDAPDISSIHLELLDDTSLAFSWSEETFLDGVIISKSYYGNNEYVELDTVFNNLTYTDNSKEFVQGTTYKFDFFRDVENRGFVFSDSALIKKVFLQPIGTAYFGNNSGTYLDVRFDHSNETHIPFYDGISVLINDNSVGFDNWVEFAMIPSEEIIEGGIRIIENVELFNVQYQIIQFIEDTLNNRIPINIISGEQIFNRISDFSFTTIDEMSGEFRITNPLLSITDGYFISGSIQDTIHSTQSIIPYTFKTPPDYPVTFSIVPFIGANIGNKVTSYPRSPNIHPPRFTNFQPVDDQTIELEWQSSGEQAIGYFIESKTSSEDQFIVIDSTDSDTRSVIVRNLNPSVNYDFKVRSYTSDDSPVITTSYINSLSIESQEELPTPGVLPEYSKSKEYLGKHSDYSSTPNTRDLTVHIENINSGQQFELSLPLDEWGSGPAIRDFAISETTNTIAVIIDLDVVDVCCSSLLIYNFITGDILVNQPVSSGANKVQITQNDSSYIYNYSNFNNEYRLFEINPFSESTILPLESIEHEPGGIEMINFSNTVLNCNQDSGLTLLELTKQAVSTILNEPCTGVRYQPSDGTVIVKTLNDFKVIDINSGSVLNSFPISNNFNPDIWLTHYLQSSDIFIYSQDFLNYRIINNGVASDFLIPSLTENRGSSIFYVEQLTGTKYSILTYDSEITVDINENWTIISSSGD